MLVNENGAVRRYKFRVNKYKGYSGNIGENCKGHHFSFPGNNLDFPSGIHPSTTLSKVGPNAMKKKNSAKSCFSFKLN